MAKSNQSDGSTLEVFYSWLPRAVFRLTRARKAKNALTGQGTIEKRERRAQAAESDPHLVD